MEVARIVVTRSNPVDPDSRVEKEVQCLVEGGYKVRILAWDRDSAYYMKESLLRLEDEVAPIVRFGIPASFGEGMKNLRPFLTFQWRMFFWLMRHRGEYDIIHACDFDTAFTAYHASKLTGKKLVFDIFDFLCTETGEEKGWLGKSVIFWQHKIINEANATIICAEERERQIKGARPKQMCVIHNTPPQLKIRNKSDKYVRKNSAIRVAYVGILQEYRLLKELAEVVAENKEFELHVGGFGKLEKYLSEMNDRYSNIFFYGKISYKEALSLEESCDIMTALYDPKIGNHRYAAPNKFYEALMLGKPLIMVRGSGMSEIVERQEIGEVVECSREGVLEGLLSLKKNRRQWERMAQRMKKLYEEMYSWEEMKGRLLTLYKKL